MLIVCRCVDWCVMMMKMINYMSSLIVVLLDCCIYIHESYDHMMVVFVIVERQFDYGVVMMSGIVGEVCESVMELFVVMVFYQVDFKRSICWECYDVVEYQIYVNIMSGEQI